MKREIWAFIDLENIGSLKDISFGTYHRLYIFVGAKQHNLSLENIPTDRIIEIKVIKIREISVNNLDFHLCYYLGRFDALEDAAIEFVVISNDKGYDNTIKHIEINGRKCKRVNTNNVNANDLLDKKIIFKVLNQENNKLPKTEESMKNYIKSHLGQRKTQKNINAIYQKLMTYEKIHSRIVKNAVC